MLGDIIRGDLRRPLEGDRNWLRREEGPFVHRVNPEHISRTRAAKAAIHVEEDLRNFRLRFNRRRNDLVLS